MFFEAPLGRRKHCGAGLLYGNAADSIPASSGLWLHGAKQDIQGELVRYQRYLDSYNDCSCNAVQVLPRLLQVVVSSRASDVASQLFGHQSGRY